MHCEPTLQLHSCASIGVSIRLPGNSAGVSCRGAAWQSTAHKQAGRLANRCSNNRGGIQVAGSFTEGFVCMQDSVPSSGGRLARPWMQAAASLAGRQRIHPAQLRPRPCCRPRWRRRRRCWRRRQGRPPQAGRGGRWSQIQPAHRRRAGRARSRRRRRAPPPRAPRRPLPQAGRRRGCPDPGPRRLGGWAARRRQGAAPTQGGTGRQSGGSV